MTTPKPKPRKRRPSGGMKPKLGMTPLERQLNRIVRGQVRSYMNDHPEMFSLKAMHREHKFNVENGIAKRLIPEFRIVLEEVRADAMGGVARVSPSLQDPLGVEQPTAPRGHPLCPVCFWRHVQRIAARVKGWLA